MFHILSYQSNLVSLVVILHFAAVSILFYYPLLTVFKNFVGASFKDVKSDHLYFLSDLSLINVMSLTPTGLFVGRVVFGTSRTLMLFLKGRHFGFKLYFRMLVINTRKLTISHYLQVHQSLD